MSNTKKIIVGLFLVSGSVTVFLFAALQPRKTTISIKMGDGTLNPDDVTQIYIGAVSEGEITGRAVSDPRELVLWDTFRDTVIYDRHIIYKMVSLINALSPDPDSYGIDARIMFSLKLKDGTKHRSGMGYRFGILYDGIIMNDNEEMFSFMDSLVYANHDLKYWAPPIIVEMVESGQMPKPENWDKKRGVRRILE